MNLLIIRHAKAEGFAMDDSARNLTEVGEAQAKKVGEFLKAQKLLPDIVLTSPYARAKQTAKIFCEVAGISEPHVEPWLACGMSPSEAIEELMAYQDFRTVAICGHNPDFAELAEWLLGSSSGGINVKTASVIYFSEVNPPSQGAQLEILVPSSAIGLEG